MKDESQSNAMPLGEAWDDAAGALPPSILRTLCAEPTISAQNLSDLARQRAAPLLEARRAAAWRRDVGLGIVLALIPLPFVLLWGAVLARWTYAAASLIFPAPFVGYAVATYGAGIVLLIGLTYAAIPLLLAGRTSPRPLQPEWMTNETMSVLR